MSRFRLFYQERCPPCRFLSRLVVILAAGAIRRVPLDSVEAAALYRERPEWRGELLMTGGGRVWTGTAVFQAVPRAVLAAWWSLLKKPFKYRRELP
jgi:hypothetical protein